MRLIATLILGLSLFATTAVAADDKAALEEQTLAHLSASNTALDAASAAVNAGDVPGTCPHLRTAGKELNTAIGLMDRYRQVLADDNTMSAADRNAQIGELDGLQTEMKQQVKDIDGLLAQHCA